MKSVLRKPFCISSFKHFLLLIIILGTECVYFFLGMVVPDTPPDGFELRKGVQKPTLIVIFVSAYHAHFVLSI